MKNIKAYLSDQKELAETVWNVEKTKTEPSSIFVNYWQMRILILKHLIKEYETTDTKNKA